MAAPVLEANDVRKHFPIRRGIFRRETRILRAVDGVSFALQRGETLGIVGESGCGKSTLARTMMWLEEPTSGTIAIDGVPIAADDVGELRERMQIVLQDPYTSLPPRMAIGDIVADPMRIHRRGTEQHIQTEVQRLFREVGIDPSRLNQYPFQFSGGQRQRIGIARALAVNPEIVVLDEAVSALDVSVQAQVLNLLQDLQERLALSYLFISHDLSVVRYLSDNILVMYLGRVVEQGPASEVYDRPIHPYTIALLSAVPSLKRGRGQRTRLTGEPPSPTDPPTGCHFHPRCPMAQPVCSTIEPPLKEWLPGRSSACHFADQLL